MSDLRPDEPPRDERLRAALRHAPDRDARPPEALSAQILRSAQQATRTPETPTTRLWRAIRSGWVALTRPAPAAAFASLMLATLIGVMWQDGPPPEERAEAIQAPAPVVQEAPAPKPADAAPAASPAPERPVEPPAPSLPKRAAPSVERRAEAEASRDASTQSSTPAAKSAPATVFGSPSAAARGTGPGAPAADTVAPPVPAAPAPPSSNEADMGRERRSVAPATAGRAESPRPAPEPAALARAPGAGSAAADPLAALAQGWSGASDAQRAALDELRRLSAGRWTRGAAPPADMAQSRALADAVEAPLGRLTITDDAVFWRPESPDDRVWRAPLPPGAAADLRQRLGLAPPR